VARRGFAITHLEHDNNFVARDGIVIDKNYMELSPGEQKAVVGKHNAYHTLYLHLLPIHKTDQQANVSLSSSHTIHNIPNYQDIVKYKLKYIVLY
jgi:hypothetical protein